MQAYDFVLLLFPGRSGGKNFENRVHSRRKIRFPWRSGHDEKIRPQKYCQTSGGLHKKRTNLYCNGIHALWRPQNVPFGQVC